MALCLLLVYIEEGPCEVLSNFLIKIAMDDLQRKIASTFPELEKALVLEMAQHAEVRDVQAGETIMRTGQYFKSAVLLLEGLVKVYREDEEGAEFFMYYLEPGNACALSLLCAQKQDVSEVLARAVTAASIIAIPLSTVDQWISRYRSWNLFALNAYRKRFEELLQTIDHVAFRNMDERLVFYLKRHKEKLRTDKIPISITEVAQELNSSREVISRLLRKLSDKGLVNVHRSYIEIVDLNKALV